VKQFKLTTSLLVSALVATFPIFAQPILEKDALAAYNWTGFYGGLNAGAMKYTMSITDNQATSFLATIQQVASPRFTGGLQAGYRRQLDVTQASGVFGLEFSANFSDALFQRDYGSSFALYQLASKNKVQNYQLLQLIGGVAAGKTFLFLTGGLSFITIRGSVTNLDSIPFFDSFTINRNALGTAWGGGVEHAISEKISARLKVDAISPNTYSTSNEVGNDYQISNSIVQATLGINYKFG
jgi:opacity protein-like surface antigen